MYAKPPFLYIEVVKPGIFTSIQGCEATGYRYAGMGPGGAMDVFAASAANSLVQNPVCTPLLEMHYPAPELLFHNDALIALTGADFCATNNGVPLQNWQTHFIAANSIIRFTKMLSGYRAYLSVYGGFKQEAQHPALPSPTVPLKKDSRLFLSKNCDFVPGTYQATVLPELYEQVYHHNGNIYCIAGPEWDSLSATAKEQLTGNRYIISPQSNRMGYRLNGDPIAHNHSAMLSSAADAGTVQLLPNGLPVILMAAHQTTGGYPRVLSVLSPSRALLAQLPPGTSIQFSVISLPEATEKLISWRQILNKLQR